MKIQTKVLSILLLVLTMMLGLAACGSGSNGPKPAKPAESSASSPESGAGNVSAAPGGKANASPDTQPGNNEQAKGIKVKVTVDDRVLTATLLDNATTRSLIAKFPLTLPMQDLYSREMCYRFPDSLPANEERTSGYEVGDISYWTPRHSFVIFYKQNGEVIGNLQKIGRIDSGVEIFSQTGNANVRFELLDK